MKAKLSLLAIGVLFLHSSWISPLMPKEAVSGLSSKTTGTTINPSFAFFRTHRQGQGIMTTWGLISTTGVSSFVVQKTYEDPYDPYAGWEDICFLPCNAARSFSHHDLNIFPGFISYRVIAYLQAGGSLMSEISTVHIVSH